MSLSAERSGYVTEELWRFLKNLACPTLVIRGKESEFVSQSDARKMCEIMPDATWREVPSAAHVPVLENPEEFSRIVEDFLGMSFDFEKEALIASGVTDEDRIDHYRGRLRKIYRTFTGQVKSTHDTVAMAKRLFAWLWSGKPSRYKRRGSFRLSEVIDNQTSYDNRAVGNCLGLTLLYNCLFRKIGVQSRAIYIDNAFGIGPHVLTLFRTEQATIDIEHIFADGFDYKGHTHKTTRTIWGNKELVAEIYHSQGNALFDQGRLSEALTNYDLAIDLNPHHEVIRLNKLILLDKMQANRRQ